MIFVVCEREGRVVHAIKFKNLEISLNIRKREIVKENYGNQRVRRE